MNIYNNRTCSVVMLTHFFQYSRRFCASVSNSSLKRVVFSGIQPTGGVPHLGNYLGALKPWVVLQNSGSFTEVVYSIVDLHALTAYKQEDGRSLKQKSLDMACALIACGIDPKVSCLYCQSHVPEHTLLFWLFSCHSSLARLFHLTQWRQKSGISKEDSNMPQVNVGLYTYPILQAADILLFKATHVPVGEDQLQHLRLSQEIARKFNNTVFPDKTKLFPVPEPLISEDTICSRLHSLREPNAKMSKSDHDQRSRIDLDDTDDSIVMKFRKAVTDPHSKLSYDPVNRPGVSNLIAIHAAVSDKNVDDILQKFGHLDTGAYKMEVAENVIETLRPIRSRLIELRSNLGEIERILDFGADRARSLAEKNWKEIASAVGIS